MTRKHFIHMARVLKNMKPTDKAYTNKDYYEQLGEDHMWDEVVSQMADLCATYNSNFDRYKFLIACGVDGDG